MVAPGDVPALARTVHHAFGWKGLARRAVHVAGVRAGWLRRQTPPGRFDEFQPLLWGFRFDLDAIRERYAARDDLDELRTRVVTDAERVLGGELKLYGWTWQQVSWPPRWHVNSFTGHEYPRVHWTGISDDDPSAGDIKDVWELSRLHFTYLFARAFALTGDDRWPETWWTAVEDWAGHNPPNVGANWRCGQETSLRAIALQFGLAAFVDHPSSTPERRALVGRILAASVARVRPTVRYALSQRNNHAISELVFLLSMRPTDERPLLRYLLEVLDDQFYDDGSYSQQSFTYQRLALHALLWLRTVRPDLPSGVDARLDEVFSRSAAFIGRCVDPVTGWAPNYGPNDGALLFPLDATAYRDMRPLLDLLAPRATAATAATASESSIWLAPDGPHGLPTYASDAGSTYVTMRGPNSTLLVRAGLGRHRPAHLDQMAIDLWIGGVNIAKDPGTYRYTAPAPWNNALTGPEVHNAPVVDEPTLTVGRFLSAPQTPAEVVEHISTDDHERLVLRRTTEAGELLRAIVRRRDSYTVVDVSSGTGGTVRWNLGPGTSYSISSPDEPTTRTTEPGDPTSGWQSDHYAQLEPIEAIEVPLRADRPVVTTFGEPLPDDELAALVSALRRS